jgi:hypothetical protein
MTMQYSPSSILRRGVCSRALRGAVALALAAGVFTVGNPAQAATVPNMFQRSCTFTDSNCSPYKQSNPPFNSSFPTECTTKGNLGAGGGTYTLPAGQHCPNNSRV